MRAAALLFAAVLVGCGVTSTAGGAITYPAGPSLAEFHVRDRCGAQDQSCHERAQDMVRVILGELGAPVLDAQVQALDDAPPEGSLAITFDAQPPFEWQAADGASGTSERVVFDLTGAARGAESYAVVGPGLAYEVDAERAADLLFALFVLTD